MIERISFKKEEEEEETLKRRRPKWKKRKLLTSKRWKFVFAGTFPSSSTHFRLISCHFRRLASQFRVLHSSLKLFCFSFFFSSLIYLFFALLPTSASYFSIFFNHWQENHRELHEYNVNEEFLPLFFKGIWSRYEIKFVECVCDGI